MKNQFYLLVMLVAMLVSCSENQEDQIIDITQEVTSKSDIPDFGVKVTSKLHRGKKWSERNDVPHCSQSFGFCTIRVESVKIDKLTIKIPKSKTNNENEENNLTFSWTNDPSVIRMSFDEPRKEYQQGIFISSEDDNVIFPDEVSEILGLSHFEIIADDYTVENTEEFPYGVTYLNVYYEQ